MLHHSSRRDFLKRSMLGAAAASSAGLNAHGALAERTTARQMAKRLGQIRLPEAAAAVQGVAVAGEQRFGTNNSAGAGLIHRYDSQWKLIETRQIRVESVDHIGAISHHDGSLWAGWLSTKEPRRSIVTEIRTKDLAVIRQFDITADVTWIDPVCFDGRHVWVGDLSDLGLHRYQINGSRLVRDAILRYPPEMHFSQGLQVRGDKLYSMHTFGGSDGLFEFTLSEIRTDGITLPVRVWPIAESIMHLEGFDFVAGRPDEIWHAQGSQVDHWQLVGM